MPQHRQPKATRPAVLRMVSSARSGLQQETRRSVNDQQSDRRQLDGSEVADSYIEQIIMIPGGRLLRRVVFFRSIFDNHAASQ